jgi:all-trans-retinol 13,14-reductase
MLALCPKEVVLRHKGLALFVFAFIPWLALAVLAYFDLVLWGAVAGLAITGAIFLIMPPGRKWGILQPFSLLFFLVACAAAIALGGDLNTRIPNLLAGGFACLTIMGGYGILEGVHFPSHYISIGLPETMVESPAFQETTRFLTLAWDGIFVLGLAADIFCMLALHGKTSISLSAILSAALIGFGMVMTPLLVILSMKKMETGLVEKGPVSIKWKPMVLTPGRPLLKNEYDAVVIGAGMGGLASACLLSTSGMKVFVAEKERTPGGYCNTYEWQGYPLNAGPTMIMGGEGSATLAMLKRLGLDREIAMRRLDWGIADGKIALRLGQGIDSDLEKLGKKFPGTRDALRRLFQDLRRFRGEIMDRYDMMAPALPLNLDEYHENFVRHPISSRWQNVTFQSMLDEYLPDSELNRLFGNLAALLGGNPRTFPAYEGAVILATLFFDGIAYPDGHFSNLTKNMAALLRHSGAEMVTSCGAEEVLFKGEGSRILPIGVRLSDGSQVRSNVVILNVDPRRAVSGLVPASTLGMDFVKGMEKLKPSCSTFTLHMIFEDDIKLPDRIFLVPAKPRRVRAADNYIQIDAVIISKERREEGKKGCGLMARINIPNNIYHVFEAGRSGKELGAELAAVVKEEIASLIPATRKSVKEFVTLPTQFAKLTSNNQGSAFGFAPEMGQWYYKRFGPRLPIPNTYLVGAWSRYGGGVEGAALSGIVAARELCGEKPYSSPHITEVLDENEENGEEKDARRGLLARVRGRRKEQEDDADE